MDPCSPQIHTNFSTAESHKFYPEPLKNEHHPKNYITDAPELSPSSSSGMGSSPRLSVGTEEMANSSPAASPSPKDGGQRTPTTLSGEIEKGRIPQGEIKFRKVPTGLPLRAKKKPKRVTNIRRTRQHKYFCIGCPEKFSGSVKREFERHFRQCKGRPYNVCPCSVGITTNHNMKAHYSSREHRKYMDRQRAPEERTSDSNPDQ
ncbi:hypothetical protein TWF506_004041 [Arthrobotrys conoides]|uniref:Uncharacterized protein n=1 Tax=Arthrobotrys conoides TaxID=74498 RepID=A0AAN8P4P9_9PEZI